MKKNSLSSGFSLGVWFRGFSSVSSCCPNLVLVAGPSSSCARPFIRYESSLVAIHGDEDEENINVGLWLFLVVAFSTCFALGVLLVLGFPDDPVGALAELLHQLVLSQHVSVDLLRHRERRPWQQRAVALGATTIVLGAEQGADSHGDGRGAGRPRPEAVSRAGSRSQRLALQPGD